MTISVQTNAMIDAEEAAQAPAPMAEARTIVVEQPLRAPVSAAAPAPHPLRAPAPARPPAAAPQPQPVRPAPVAAPQAAKAGAPGVDAFDFIRANRIHVKDGSLFVDPYLAIHPRELAPENDTALRRKLQLTYSINNPSFFESKGRMAIALNLGQLLPVSLEAKQAQLAADVRKFNTQAQTGRDSDLERDLARKMAPFSSIVRRVTEQPEADPVGMEVLKNSLAMYMLVREKMTQLGYLEKLTKYVVRSATPDQVMADLASMTGVSPLHMREAALRGGLEGVGQLLGLDPRYVKEARGLAEYASTQDFSYNVVEHWHLGRQLQGITAPLSEKLTVGMDQRITAKIAEYRDKVHHQFDVPAPAKKQQLDVAEGLKLVDPIQRALMFRLGYEICYSPEVNADAIAFYRAIYGLHRKAANDLRDILGTYRIYFSGHGDLKGSMRTLVHEVAHNLWPEQFSPEEAARVDQLAKADQRRFELLQHLMEHHYTEFETLFNSYKYASSDGQRQAMVNTANRHFAAYGVDMAGLFPYLRDAHDFKFVVKHAYDTLSVEGERYNRSGYHGPEERMREVISRFAELKQVEYRSEPQFLQFLAPGLNQVWENHYIPHLHRVYQGIVNGTIPPTHKPTAAQDMMDGAADAIAAKAQEQNTAAPQPKVEQRPQPVPVQAEAVPARAGVPAPEAPPAQACITDDAPNFTVDAPSIEMNDRVLHAENALEQLSSRVH